jgi:hypothetical protein
MGIEPISPVWKTGNLPLVHTRFKFILSLNISVFQPKIISTLGIL